MRDFLRKIESSGHLDLRALLDEGTLANHLDGLVELAARNDGPGLRALGATADITTQRLYRLLSMGDKVKAAPALSHFLKALQLFLDTFTSSEAGYRLLYIGRPAIAQRGRLGFGALDPATTRLMTLIGQRAQLAGFADCFLSCECDLPDVLRQVMLDKVLHDTDRAIDLYILGRDGDGDGEAEWRAAGYGVLIGTLGRPGVIAQDRRPPPGPFRNTPLGTLLGQIEATLTLGKFNGRNNRAAVPPADRVGDVADELCLQRLTNARLESVIRTMSGGCVPAHSRDRAHVWSNGGDPIRRVREQSCGTQ